MCGSDSRPRCFVYICTKLWEPLTSSYDKGCCLFSQVPRTSTCGTVVRADLQPEAEHYGVVPELQVGLFLSMIVTVAH